MANISKRKKIIMDKVEAGKLYGFEEAVALLKSVVL